MSVPQNALSSVHRTAINAAAMRAAHLLRPGEPKIFSDAFALRLADITDAEALAFADMHERVAEISAWPLRSRFAEDRLAAARERIDQYVLLGAGLDSYALRMDGRLGSMIVYEVDDPPFQQWKRQRIEELDLKVPPQLRFVPCDFERASLVQALADAGFEDKEPCFVSWLGVTQYLTREAILQTLHWAGGRPSGSEIVLTFVAPGHRAEAIRQAAARIGLEFATFFAPEEMTAMLHRAGFSRVGHLTPSSAQALYFRDRSDGLKAPEVELLVSATV